jgi:hypothetical protein
MTSQTGSNVINRSVLPDLLQVVLSHFGRICSWDIIGVFAVLDLKLEVEKNFLDHFELHGGF